MAISGTVLLSISKTVLEATRREAVRREWWEIAGGTAVEEGGGLAESGIQVWPKLVSPLT